MRKLTFVAVLAITASFAGGCAERTARIKEVRAARSTAATETSAPVDKMTGETLDELIVRLHKEPEGETKEERRIRLRALDIALQRLAEETKRDRRATESATEYRAEREIEKEDRRQTQVQDALRRSMMSAQITGCDSGVWVNPRATDSSSWLVGANIRILNTSTTYMDIETSARGLGLVVKDLCPGGGVTLSFVKPIAGQTYESITLTAISRQVGVMFQPRLYTISLDASRAQYERVHSYSWQIY